MYLYLYSIERNNLIVIIVTPITGHNFLGTTPFGMSQRGLDSSH